MLPQSKPPNSGLAVGAMVAGIAAAALGAIGWCSWLLAVPAILAGGAGLVLGIIARRQITGAGAGQQQGAPPQQGGAGMALAGIICGAVGAGLGLIGLILNLVLLAAYLS